MRANIEDVTKALTGHVFEMTDTVTETAEEMALILMSVSSSILASVMLHTKDTEKAKEILEKCGKRIWSDVSERLKKD